MKIRKDTLREVVLVEQKYHEFKQFNLKRAFFSYDEMAANSDARYMY